MRTKNNEFRKDWSVAELKVSYKPARNTIQITDSCDAYQVFRQMWDKELINIQEQMCALYLNPANEVIGFRIISTGKISESTIDAQLIIAIALVLRATTIIIAHNHPCGDCTPSQGDIDTTEAIQQMTNCLGLCLSDHLIITENDFISFADFATEQPKKKKTVSI